jgi:hypothetical protein
MSISLEAQSYLISGMGSTTSGNNLISAIQNGTVLSTIDFTRLSDATEPDVASNIQACILGTYSLSVRDTQFLKDGFSMPDSALASVLANLAGGVQVPGYPNFLPNVAPNAYPNGFANSSPMNVTMPAGFSFAVNFVGPALQQYDVMTFPAGSAFASTGAGEYFKIYTGGNSNSYYVWYNVSGGSNTDPAPAGFTGIEVTILSGDTAAQVAAKTVLAMNATSGGMGAFAVLGASAVTNTGNSVLTGDLGIYPGTSITGFPPAVYSGGEHIADGVASSAQTAAQASFTAKQTLGLAGTTIAAELGGQTLTPGNYQSATSFGLSLTSGHSTLTFNGAGTYILYSPSTLLTGASGSTDVPTMVFTGGATASNTSIYWIVGSSATINQSVASAGATFYGNVIAEDSITVTEGGTVNGSLIALTGAVTLSAATAVVAPSTGPETPVMAEAFSSSNGAVVTTVLLPVSSQVARPAFSPLGGSYPASQTVTISSGTVGAAIYFSVNGSTPTVHSTLYTGPITVSASETVQAIAILAGQATSQVGSAAYVIT